MNVPIWKRSKEGIAKLSLHLSNYWFFYALAIGLLWGNIFAAFFVSIPFLALQARLQQRRQRLAYLRARAARPTPQAGEIIRDPRTGEPVIDPETNTPFVVPLDVRQSASGGALLVNPATGALMVGGMAGVDVFGNPFGANLSFNPATGAPVLGDTGVDVLGNPFGADMSSSDYGDHTGMDYTDSFGSGYDSTSSSGID